MLNHLRRPLVLAAAALSVAAAGCKQSSDPVSFSVTVPSPNVLGFQANLTKKYGIGLAGTFNLPKDVGSVTLVPETNTQGFGLATNLNTRAFLKDTWGDFQEVTALPTGAAFPAWSGVPVVHVHASGLTHHGVNYHFYLGVRGQYNLGVAGVIDAIDEDFPAVNIGYTFYDKKGRVILGFQFFGPKLGSNGKAEVPGGIFIGTNLTPFLPKELQPNPGQLVSASQMRDLVQRAHSGKPVVINGVAATSHIEATGRDAHRYRSGKSLQKLVNRYMEASRKTY